MPAAMTVTFRVAEPVSVNTSCGVAPGVNGPDAAIYVTAGVGVFVGSGVVMSSTNGNGGTVPMIVRVLLSRAICSIASPRMK